MARRYGADAGFWWDWTAAEAVAKAIDVPILAFLHRHGLRVVRGPGDAAYDVEVDGQRLRLEHARVGDDVVVCTAVAVCADTCETAAERG